ncbi:hypothetical protein PVAP13_5KG193221 [Panicum virgatum]|uniref:Uncharacterized protein n=1 Tax=Panicum virgatum TaxID=38727 RepID=A0A8T0SFS3_PANVG|nr:hypothetical protein PVAP13_5KG193221 [Panicum virgatum]
MAGDDVDALELGRTRAQFRDRDPHAANPSPPAAARPLGPAPRRVVPPLHGGGRYGGARPPPSRIQLQPSLAATPARRAPFLHRRIPMRRQGAAPSSSERSGSVAACSANARRPPPVPRELPRPAALSTAGSKEGGEGSERARGLRPLLKGRHAALSAAAAARVALRLLTGHCERPRRMPRPLPLSFPLAAPVPAANELPVRRPYPCYGRPRCALPRPAAALRRRGPLLPPPRRPFPTARALPSSSMGRRTPSPTGASSGGGRRSRGRRPRD